HHALEQFGPMARTVLDAWGIRRCGDFGEIVFNLIDYNVFSKTDNDKREDFSDIFTFEDAFDRPFLPARPRVVASNAPREVSSP
ncbi:MAG TPA: Minf_1886 family protein, partial [Candidatus Synoicihabitans sp.]|nr:Minf_1886 family protein [Candidatus Synoicihabitans sp.]